MRRLMDRALAAALLGCGLVLAAMQPGLAQGKRLAFVVGLGDYGATQHPTALPDAGLVAQTLKGAGFEVTEAANLNQSEFRTLFRDFSDKAMEAGPDAVITVYVAGLALQDDGDNILIPIDARLRQRNDLATEGLRIADFLRGVSGLPARARFVFLDAAYQHPVLQLVADGGRGLSLADRAEGTLIGFNQSPGRAAPLPATNYGPFAMALAEVLLEPGLPVETMAERLRLRVHDLTQGTVTPWLLNAVSPGFVLNPGGPGVATAVAPEAALLRERPMSQLTAEQAYARAVEVDTIAAYEDFIRAFPNHALAKRARATVAARREAAYWARTRRANTERAYWTYLKRYPRGAHAEEAEDRLIRLSAPVAPPPSFEEVFYDDLAPPPPEELVIYEEIVVTEHWDRLPPPWTGPVGFLPPPPVAIIELPPAPPPRIEERGLPLVAITAGVVGITAAAILANRAWRRPPKVRETTFVPPPRPPREPGYGRRPVVLPPGADQRGLTAPQITNRPPLVRPIATPTPSGPGSIPGVLNPTRPGAIPPPPVPPGTRPDSSGIQPPGQRPTSLPPPVGRPGMDGQPPGIRPDLRPTPPGTGGPAQRPAIATPPGTGGPGQRPDLRPTPPGTGGPAQRPAIASPPGTGGPAARPIGPTPPATPGITPPRSPGDSGLVAPSDRRPNVNPGVNPAMRQPTPPQFRPPPPQGRPMPQVQQPGMVQPRPMPPPQTRQPVQGLDRPGQPQFRQPPPQARPAPPMMRPPEPQPQPQMRPPAPPMARPAPSAPPPIARPTPPAPPPMARPAPSAPPSGLGRPANCTPPMRAAGQC